MQWVSFIAICIYLFSLAAYTNEMGLVHLGTKTYLSTIFGPVAFVTCVLAGSLLRGARTRIGKFWIAFFLFLAVDIPFSSWRGGSFRHVVFYCLPGQLIFFIICANVLHWKQIRIILYVLAGAFLVVLAYCVAFGATDGSRFQLVQGSLANANDLALHLVLSLPILLYLFTRPGIMLKMIGVPAAALAVLYIFRTGSRSSFLTLLVLCLVMFCVFPAAVRIRLAVLAGVIALLTVMFVPSAALTRLVDINVGGEPQEGIDDTNLDSQLERQAMFTTSLKFTFQHPLFGVGPGQFANYLFGDATKRGEWIATLGTHNSYTQVSSECGIPAFICYAAVVILAVRSNFRIYKAARGTPALKPVADLAFCLFMVTLAYAVNTMFAHIAYTYYLPAFAGLSVALKLAADPLCARPSSQTSPNGKLRTVRAGLPAIALQQ